MQRIFWIDQRISGGVVMLWFLPGRDVSFFGRWWISAMSDRGHHSEGEHHQGHVTVLAMPGSALIVIEPELVFRGFKAILDRPSMAFDRDQRFNGCSRWAPGVKKGVHHRRCDDGSVGRASKNRHLHCWTARPRGRPIRDRCRSFGSGSHRQALPVG